MNSKKRGAAGALVLVIASVALIALGRGNGATTSGSAPLGPSMFEGEEAAEEYSELRLGAALPLILGGFKGLVADAAWMRVQLAWERGDEAAVERWSSVATTINPDVPWFWLNSARMLAYDFADARLTEAERAGPLTDASRRQINDACARRALDRLASGLGRHTADAQVWMEMGNIHMNRREDLSAAAECYQKAVSFSDAPLYAQRILSGLLWRVGRYEDALDELRKHHQRLVGSAPGSVDPMLLLGVEQRLREWCRELEDPRSK